MSKLYNWWLDQLCLNCGHANEQCNCNDEYPEDPIGELNND